MEVLCSTAERMADLLKKVHRRCRAAHPGHPTPAQASGLLLKARAN